MKERIQDGGRRPGPWAPNAAFCGTGEGSQGSLGGRYPESWRGRKRKEREREATEP